MSGELQGEDEPGEDGTQHMWVSNTLGPTMPGRSFIPSDKCASEFLKIHIFIIIIHFPSRGGHHKTPTPTGFLWLFFILEHVRIGKKKQHQMFPAMRKTTVIHFHLAWAKRTFYRRQRDGMMVSKVGSPSKQQGNQRRKCAPPVEGANPA